MKRMSFLAIAGLFIWGLVSCQSVHSQFTDGVKAEFRKQPMAPGQVLTIDDIQHLPVRLQQYLVFAGAVGKPVPGNFRLVFDGRMVRKPGAEPMDMPVEQYNFFDRYARHFTMGSSIFLIPFAAVHQYSDESALFQVRIASLYNTVDLKGDTLTQAETVTILNDLCLYNPAALTDPRIRADETDSGWVRIRLKNGKNEVSAVLDISQAGVLNNFVSDDRYALEENGSMRNVRWSTPVTNWKEVDGRRVPGWGAAVYHYPEGDFQYADFTFRSVEYDVKGLVE